MGDAEMERELSRVQRYHAWKSIRPEGGHTLDVTTNMTGFDDSYITHGVFVNPTSGFYYGYMLSTNTVTHHDQDDIPITCYLTDY